MVVGESVAEKVVRTLRVVSEEVEEEGEIIRMIVSKEEGGG